MDESCAAWLETSCFMRMSVCACCVRVQVHMCVHIHMQTLDEATASASAGSKTAASSGLSTTFLRVSPKVKRGK